MRLFDGKVRLAGGVRQENVELSVNDFTTLASYGSRRVTGGTPKFEATLVNGGVVYEPLDGVRAYASYAEGYTVPDVGRILRSINVEASRSTASSTSVRWFRTIRKSAWR
jgi:iron complex outermembrane receptor protein